MLWSQGTKSKEIDKLYNFRGTNQNTFVLAQNLNMISLISMSKFEKETYSEFEDITFQIFGLNQVKIVRLP